MDTDLDLDLRLDQAIKNFDIFLSDNTTRTFTNIISPIHHVTERYFYEFFINGYRYISNGTVVNNGKLELVLFKPKLTGSAKLNWSTPFAETKILEMAKVSGDNKTVTNMKLLQTLYNSGHFSPFQMCNMCIEIETSREVGRQVIRHWSIHFNELNVQELSQRYKCFGEKPSVELENTIQALHRTDLPLQITVYPFFYKEWRLQSKKNRQASYSLSEIFEPREIEEFKKTAKEFEFDQYQLYINSIYTYRKFEHLDGAREVIRTFGLESMTPSTIHMNGTIRSWIHYLQSRALKMTGIAQQEHEHLALKILDIFKQICPCTHELMIGGRLTSFEVPQGETLSDLASVASGVIGGVTITSDIRKEGTYIKDGKNQNAQ